MMTESKPKASHCDAPGHEDCSGWILCDHPGDLLEHTPNDEYEWWCRRCDEAAEGPVWTWCPERTN